MSKQTQKRKTFYLDDKQEKPLRAGGVLLYKIVEDDVELLLISSRGLYEDIGGCTDHDDDDIYDTVAREVEEETNEVITYDSIKTRLEDAMYVYSSKSKYIIFIVKAQKEEEKLEKKHFGTKEIFDNIDRTIDWVSLDTFLDKNIIRYKLNFRLKNKNLFDKLKSIKSNIKKSIRII